MYVYAAEANMKTMMRYSKEEYQDYKSKNKLVYLQQACEKLWAVMNNYLEVVNDVRIEGAPQAKKLIVKEKPLEELYYQILALHRFFYVGDYEYNERYIEEQYLDAYEKLKSRIERLG